MKNKDAIGLLSIYLYVFIEHCLYNHLKVSKMQRNT